jgi:hypothetical protein
LKLVSLKVVLGSKLFSSIDSQFIELDSRTIPPAASEEEMDLMKEVQISSSLENFYKIHNGLNYQWTSVDNPDVGGNIQFNKHIWLLRDDQSLTDQCDMDPNMDERLRHFRVWDVPTMNTMVGFLHSSETGFSRSLYFYTQGTTYAKSLELDVDGYLNMAYESAGFYYWQQVLLDIINESETPETRKFKEWMPKLFPDFNWDDFLAKYQELRLK